MTVKSDASQAVLALHRVHRQLIDMRRMQGNQLKGLLYEFGVLAPASAGITAMQVEHWLTAGRVPGIGVRTGAISKRGDPHVRTLRVPPGSTRTCMFP